MRGELVLLYKKIKNIKNKVLFNKFRRILLSHAKKYVNKSSINKSKIDLKFEKYFINEKNLKPVNLSKNHFILPQMKLERVVKDFFIKEK